MNHITPLPLDLKLITLTTHTDNRGEVAEIWRQEWLPETGFVQENISVSHYGVVRGLHFQRKYPHGKLIRYYRGKFAILHWIFVRIRRHLANIIGRF